MMRSIFLGTITALVLTGCAGNAPLVYTNETIDATENQVRNVIIQTAKQYHWNVCQAEGKQLRADLTYKKWKVFEDIDYGENYYRISPNLEYTTLAREDGTVHRAVNNLTKRLDRQVRLEFRTVSRQTEKPLEISPCVSYDYTDTEKLGVIFGARVYVTTNFAWLHEAVQLPKGTKFQIKVNRVDPSLGISQENVVSMQDRMHEYLQDRELLGSNHKTDYLIKLDFKSSSEHSRGGFLDFGNLADSHEQLQVHATIKSPQGQSICVIDSSTRADTSGFTGIINKSTNKVTAGVSKGILDSLEKYLIAK